MSVTLRDLLVAGHLLPLDVELVETLSALAGEEDPFAKLALAFASHAVQDGHACVALAELARRTLADGDGREAALSLPDEGTLRRALEKSPLVDPPEGQGGDARPFVLDSAGRLYLRRYFEYEERLAGALLARVGAVAGSGDEAHFRAALERLFPADEPRAELQRSAAELVTRSRLAVVSGGPGTGKTHTVSKILILMLGASDGPPPKVALLAPTGKAAQRLGDSIRSRVQALGSSERARTFAFEPMTIHRALGFQPGSPTRFRHDAKNPLAAELVVVDEASMVDLALMTKLVEAVRPDARLVLVGDKDQLASVEAGAILAEVCAARGAVAEHVVELVHAHRFEDGGGIAELARAVNAGDAERALDCFGRHANVRLEALDEPRAVLDRLRAEVVDRFSPLFTGEPEERLAALDAFRVLGCHREGSLGVRALNDWIEGELRSAGKLEGRERFYDGRPLIVTANDYQAELFNGDVAVVRPRLEAPSPAPLAAYFRARDAGAVRALSPARLPDHETAFALTVHKAQGSESLDVALVLPSRPSPILTRELVYTAVTRARRSVTIYGSVAVLRSAIEKRVERASGLRDRLERA